MVLCMIERKRREGAEVLRREKRWQRNKYRRRRWRRRERGRGGKRNGDRREREVEIKEMMEEEVGRRKRRRRQERGRRNRNRGGGNGGGKRGIRRVREGRGGQAKREGETSSSRLRLYLMLPLYYTGKLSSVSTSSYGPTIPYQHA